MCEPSPAASECDCGLEVLLELVEACGEPSQLLEVSEGSFDAIALLIEGFVEGSLHQAHAAGWNDGFDATLGEVVQDRVGVVALVREHGYGLSVAEQRQGLGAIVRLAAGKHEAERQAERVGEQVNLGRQTSSIPPQSAPLSLFFWAVAACWCARTTLGSIMT